MSKKGGFQTPSWLPKAAVGVLMALCLYLVYTRQSGSPDGAITNLTGSSSNGGNDRGQEIIKRFIEAKTYVKRMKEIGKNELFTMTACPEKFSIGFRTTPGQIIPEYVGNTCEPWIARFALIFLDRLLDSSMDGLEWSTGSSTQWVLMRVKSLISIEHHAKWSKMVEEALQKIYSPQDLEKRWQLHAVEPLPGTKEKGPDKEDPIKFNVRVHPSELVNLLPRRDYIAATFLPEKEGIYDYISVDGRARVHCLKRALPLLKPDGGILMLDNSEREWYADAFAAVPDHWLRFDDFVNTGERTTIFVSCKPGRCGENLQH